MFGYYVLLKLIIIACHRVCWLSLVPDQKLV